MDQTDAGSIIRCIHIAELLLNCLDASAPRRASSFDVEASLGLRMGSSADCATPLETVGIRLCGWNRLIYPEASILSRVPKEALLGKQADIHPSSRQRDRVKS